jgi:hypothetical protein
VLSPALQNVKTSDNSAVGVNVLRMQHTFDDRDINRRSKQYTTQIIHPMYEYVLLKVIEKVLFI